MPVTLPECAGIDTYTGESDRTPPAFLDWINCDGDRLSPYVRNEFCCRIASWDCHYGAEGGYFIRWHLHCDDLRMRTYYTLSDQLWQ